MLEKEVVWKNNNLFEENLEVQFMVYEAMWFIKQTNIFAALSKLTYNIILKFLLVN